MSSGTDSSSDLSREVEALLEKTLSGTNIVREKKKTEPGKRKSRSGVFSSTGNTGRVAKKEKNISLRVRPDTLKREMDKIRGEGPKPKKKTEPAIRATSAPEEELKPGKRFTSSDIFGPLIQDIESGMESEAESPTHPALSEEMLQAPTVAIERDVASQHLTEPPVRQPGRGAPIALPVDGEVREKPRKQGANEYQLLSKIAIGGMAEVWKAKLVGEKGFEKIVAIKKILPHLGDNEEFISMFIDEAKVAANLTHPNIAQIYELGKMSDTFFIAMEHVGGHNLRTLLGHCKDMHINMTAEVAVYIGMKLANALSYAHNKKGYEGKPLNIVHRDISPQNIIISNEGEIKLVDFGIAKASIKATETVAGSLKGKLLYMSPEQGDGNPIDGRSDIFSLANVLYEALTGYKLFSGNSELAVLKKVREAQFPSPRELNPDIPEALEVILLKALSKDPTNRYDSAKALENDFKEFLKQRKAHLNESDIADYLAMIINRDEEKLKAIGVSSRITHSLAPVPGSPQVRQRASLPGKPAALDKPKNTKKRVGLGFVVLALLLALVAVGVWFGLDLGKSVADRNADTAPPPLGVAEPVNPEPNASGISDEAAQDTHLNSDQSPLQGNDPDNPGQVNSSGVPPGEDPNAEKDQELENLQDELRQKQEMLKKLKKKEE